jgi:phosphopantothenoylcysteine decarboxylase/phosphopantothenate--cysteine ligase
VLVTAGGTREPIDPVRFITNRSSGRQGHAVAEAAVELGADVTLVTASALALDVSAATSVTRIDVETAAQMRDAVLGLSAQADVVVMAAAVSDFRPVAEADSKIHKEDGVPVIALEPTQDILATLVERRARGQVIVGFAAETGDATARGRAKLARKGCDLLVVNDVSKPETGFDHETNEVDILDAQGGEQHVALASKRAVAEVILARVGHLIEQGDQ